MNPDTSTIIRRSTPFINGELFHFDRLRANRPQAHFTPILNTESGVRLFAPSCMELEGIRPSRPLRLLVITSLRDIAAEKTGRAINVDGSEQIFKGSLQALAEASNQRLKPFIEIAGIVVDDVPGQDGVESMGYPLLPQSTKSSTLASELNWIAPADLQVNSQQTIAEVTVNIPSSFRKLPRSASNRIAEKFRFERSIISHALDIGADFILSDHCILKFETIHRSDEYKGRVLNIHPGITWREDPNSMRGLTPTQDTLKRAIDTGYCKMGASLHFISDEIDGGEVIGDCEKTIFQPQLETTESLRFKNYRDSKIPALVDGIEYYTCNFRQLSKSFAATLD